MAETGEAAVINFDNFADNLEEKIELASQDLVQADAFEAEAKRIRYAVPVTIDNAIQLATENLLALATPEATTTQGRKLLAAVLRINQHKPSRTVWSGPADTDGTLKQYDEVQVGAPALLVMNAVFGRVPGLIATAPESVGVSVSQGMGGLPQANIRFGFQVMALRRGQPAHLNDEVETVTISHSRLAASKIGIKAIQSHIDSAELETREYPSGYEEVENIGDLLRTAAEAAGLIAVSKAVFDMTHLDEVIIRGERQIAHEKGRAADRAAYRQRHNIPTLYR